MNGLYLMIALISGTGLAAQVAINSRLSAGLGSQPVVASMFSFAVGTLCLLVISYFVTDWQTVAVDASKQPWWRWVGGAIGAVFVTTSIYLSPKIGVSNTVFLFIIGQLFMGMAIDHFGWLEMPVRPLYWWKLTGMAVMMLGLSLFMFGERWFGRS